MSLFERIGGLDVLQTVVKKFYKLVYVDDLVGHYFQNLDMEDMIDHQIRFLRHALGDDVGYTGKGIEKAHAHLSITDEEFNRVGELLISSLEYAKVGDEEKEKIMRIVVSVKHLIVKDESV